MNDPDRTDECLSGNHEAEDIVQIRSGQIPSFAYLNDEGISLGICKHCRCVFVEK